MHLHLIPLRIAVTSCDCGGKEPNSVPTIIPQTVSFICVLLLTSLHLEFESHSFAEKVPSRFVNAQYLEDL